MNTMKGLARPTVPSVIVKKPFKPIVSFKFTALSTGQQTDLFDVFYRNPRIKDIADILSNAVKNISGSSRYYNVIALVNSSCVGKTRGILEYAKSHRVVYFLCKSVINGLVMPPVFINMMARIIPMRLTFTMRNFRILSWADSSIHILQKFGIRLNAW